MIKLGALWEVPTEPDVRSVTLMAGPVFDATVAPHPGLRPVSDVEAQAQLDNIGFAAGHEDATATASRDTLLRTHFFKVLCPDLDKIYLERGERAHFIGHGFRYTLVPTRDTDDYITNDFWAIEDDTDGFPKVAVLLDDPVEHLLVELSPYRSFGQFVRVLCQLVRMFSDPLALGSCPSGHRDVLTRDLELLLGCLRLAGGVPEGKDARHAADAAKGDGSDNEPVHETHRSAEQRDVCTDAKRISQDLSDILRRHNPAAHIEGLLRQLGLDSTDDSDQDVDLVLHGHRELAEKALQVVRGELPQLDSEQLAGIVDALKDLVGDGGSHGDSPFLSSGVAAPVAEEPTSSDAPIMQGASDSGTAPSSVRGSVPLSDGNTGVVPAWTFGDRLRKVRRVNNLTQIQFAEALGVNPKSLAAWEADAWEPHDIVSVARRIRSLGGPARTGRWVWIRTRGRSASTAGYPRRWEATASAQVSPMTVLRSIQVRLAELHLSILMHRIRTCCCTRSRGALTTGCSCCGQPVVIWPVTVPT
ncbi:helix-turn-helix transcriptional regulator [Micropruina sp.]|uniref:helix-turn-helix transcriptional regulator n=1 Tax=Micropruina sp. TaxID=2737536 RepID=UPI0039E71574